MLWFLTSGKAPTPDNTRSQWWSILPAIIASFSFHRLLFSFCCASDLTIHGDEISYFPSSSSLLLLLAFSFIQCQISIKFQPNSIYHPHVHCADVGCQNSEHRLARRRRCHGDGIFHQSWSMKTVKPKICSFPLRKLLYPPSLKLHHLLTSAISNHSYT